MKLKGFGIDSMKKVFSGFLEKEGITFGGSISISRDKFSLVLFQNIAFRESMKKFYSTPEKINETAEKMNKLWKNLQDGLPYINSKYPFLSDAMAESLKQTRVKEVEEMKHIVDVLCNFGSFSIYEEILKLGYDKKLKIPSIDEARAFYIQKVGIDKVIEASRYAKKISINVNHEKYQNVLNQLREKRGEDLSKREIDSGYLSKYAAEDLMYYEENKTLNC